MRDKLLRFTNKRVFNNSKAKYLYDSSFILGVLGITIGVVWTLFFDVSVKPFGVFILFLAMISERILIGISEIIEKLEEKSKS